MAERSFVRVPVRIPLKSLFGALESRAPTRIGAGKNFEAAGNGIQIRYSITRAALDMKPDHARLEVRDVLHYWLESRGGDAKPARCGDASAPILVEVGWNVRLGWQDDWKLDSRIDAIPTHFAARCRSGPEEHQTDRETRERKSDKDSEGEDFTDFLNDRIQAEVIGPITSHMDSTLRSSVEPRRALEAAWEALEQPIDLEGGSVWLSWNVEEVVAEPITISGDAVECDLAVIARPLVTLGQRPVAPSIPLPGTKVRLTRDQLAITLDCAIPLDAVNARLHPRVTSAREGARTALEIKGIHASGDGNRLTIAVDLGGRTPRQAHLVGRLAYHPEGFRLAAEELDYTPESRAALFDVEGRGDGARHRDFEALRTDLMQDLIFDLDKRVPSGMVQIGHGLNRRLTDRVSIHGGVRELRTLGTYATDRALGVRLAAVGKAALEVQ